MTSRKPGEGEAQKPGYSTRHTGTPSTPGHITTRPRNRLDGRHHSTQTRTTNHTPNSTKNTASGNSSDIASTGNTSLHHTHNRAQLSIPISIPANHKQHLKWNARNSGTETAHNHQRQTRYLTAGEIEEELDAAWEKR